MMKSGLVYLINCVILVGLSLASGYSDEAKKHQQSALAFFDRTIFLQEQKPGGKSFSGIIVEKEGVFFLAVCKHSIRQRNQKLFACLPNRPHHTLEVKGLWVSHKKADLSVAVNPIVGLSAKQLSSYAIAFDRLSQAVPAKLTPVVISGYPTRLVTKPKVSPIVRTSIISSIETESKSGGEDSIPVFFLNDFSGMGASGSPVFDYRNKSIQRPECIGILAGGWNSSANTGSVVTPAYYLRELIKSVSHSRDR